MTTQSTQAGGKERDGKWLTSGRRNERLVYRL